MIKSNLEAYADGKLIMECCCYELKEFVAELRKKFKGVEVIIVDTSINEVVLKTIL